MKAFIHKLFFYSFCFVYSQEAGAQTHLTLVLNTSEPVDTAVFVHWTDREMVKLPFKDTLYIDFKTTGIDFYHLNYLVKEKIYNAQLYLDTGHKTVILKISNGKLSVDSVIGSPMFKKVTGWKETYAKLKEQKDSVGLDSFLLTTYEENLDNQFSFAIGNYYLKIHQNDPVNLYPLLPLIARQSEEVKKRFGFSSLNDRLQGLINNESINLSAFNLIDINNKLVQPKTPKSGFVILDFWFVSCVPCIEDHLKIPGILPLFKEKGVEFISISDDDSYKKWKNYLSRHNYQWQQYIKPDEKNNIVDHLGISSYPTYILLNETGRILYNTNSLEAILKQVNIR